MRPGLGSGGCHHLSMAVRRRWATASRHRACRGSQRRFNSSQPSSSSPANSSEATTRKPPTTTTTTTPRHHSSVSKPTASSPPPTLPAKPTHSLREAIKSSPVGRVADMYSRAQDRRPYVTQLWCSVIIYLCGDLSAQLLFADEGGKKDEQGAGGKEEEEGVEEKAQGGYDPLRTLRHLSIGMVASVPSYKWFMFVHHHFNFPSKFLSILTKVVVQQVAFTPTFNIYFFSMQSLLAGATPAETYERLKKALPTSIANSVKLWPAVTAFSFVYVDPQFRPVFFGVIAVGWQSYLSWLNQKAARQVGGGGLEEVEALPRQQAALGQGEKMGS